MDEADKACQDPPAATLGSHRHQRPRLRAAAWAVRWQVSGRLHPRPAPRRPALAAPLAQAEREAALGGAMVRGLLCRLGAWSAAVWSASALGKADASRSDAQARPREPHPSAESPGPQDTRCEVRPKVIMATPTDWKPPHLYLWKASASNPLQHVDGAHTSGTSALWCLAGSACPGARARARAAGPRDCDCDAGHLDVIHFGTEKSGRPR